MVVGVDNPFRFSDTNKRYLTQSYYLKQRFGQKVMKISLNGGFTCPNIDGTKGTGGCAFCSAGSGRFAGDPHKSITEQFEDIRRSLEPKWGRGLYIPYFQSNTNTYCTVGKLSRLTDEALSQPDVVGLAISTRPDCISDDMLSFLSELSDRTYLTVELGVQTIHDSTAVMLNRCHTYGDFLRTADRLYSKGILFCAHIIDGLPGETFDMMMQTAEAMAKLPLHSIKIHLLHVLKGTRLADSYMREEFSVMTLEDYVETVCSQLEVLPPELIIQRLTGDGAKGELIAPLWSMKKFVVLNEIDKYLASHGSMQGIRYRGGV
ncbi:MAG: TIGR01212 family radical SAM protein [Oscillospiraceae bacterium]|nr:TIGR01212 family radical SAM protein [Oscillospiraceae bacterium]